MASLDSISSEQGRTVGVGSPASAFARLEQRPPIDPRASRLISADQATRLRAVPFHMEDGRLHVAMADPSDFEAADEISVSSGMPVTRLEATPDVLRDMMREGFGTTAAAMGARLGEGQDETADELIANLEAIDADELHRMAEQPTLINLVNLIILEAVRSRSSDVHIEPFERRVSVRYRVDGVLIEQSSPPKHLQPAITSRIKIMAGMNIAERYVPQDGHITLRFEGRKVDVRVSTVPTIYGESVVMRILDKESVRLDLAELGMRDRDCQAMQRLIDLPHGMVLVTGPTGSGKTTTLYAAISKLYDPTLKIITIEDPVEYELGGVNQIPVNPKRGLTFATGLRSILRQDPDVIMVGEIRDKETADIAVRSALTGHLLFSTLHTNDAVSAVGRLLDMDVEPFLLASVLEGVLAQRLGRKLCTRCKAQGPLPEAVRHRLTPSELALFPGGRCHTAVGCEYCSQSGYKGRVGYFEVLEVTGEMRAGISQQLSGRDLLRMAGAGHETIRRDGMIKAGQGVTTIDEVFRATQDAEDLAA